LTSQDVDIAIHKYGRTLVPLPDQAYSLLDVVPVSDSQPQRWSVVVPLWSEEEGRSDLSLTITVEDVDGQDYVVEIDDLHVL
jgi:hypothetical protein